MRNQISYFWKHEYCAQPYHKSYQVGDETSIRILLFTEVLRVKTLRIGISEDQRTKKVLEPHQQIIRRQYFVLFLWMAPCLLFSRYLMPMDTLCLIYGWLSGTSVGAYSRSNKHLRPERNIHSFFKKPVGRFKSFHSKIPLTPGEKHWSRVHTLLIMLLLGQENPVKYTVIELLSPALLRWPALKISQAEPYLVFHFFLFNLIECKIFYIMRGNGA